MSAKRIVVLIAGLLLLGLLLTACSQQECPDCPDCAEAQCPETECPQAECPEAECPTCPEPEACPEPAACPSAVVAPFEAQWASSGHANAEAEAFRHWDGGDPAVVSTSCAKCHSEYGYLDFLGADGTEAGVVDNAAAIDSVVSCVACHNDATASKTSVVFPSGVELTGLGPETRCMECHQGRAWGGSVDQAIADAGLADMDTPSADLGFTNIHYFAAAATQAGGLTMAGYQYEGKAYDSRFDHVAGYDTCVGCHNSHTLELKVEECAACHTDSDPKDIRMAGSLVDYDGDGDMEEGIYYEIAGLQETLYQAIQTYATEVAGTPIVYDPASHPYFFVDDPAAAEPTAYNAWTGRLAKAAYNYQTSSKDPGAFAHGGKYIIQLLFDSIEDLNPALVASLHRIDHGHFAGSEEAFRYWDEDGEVPNTCATCHSADGLPFILENGVQVAHELSNGFNCATCHSDLTTFAVREVGAVTFPSGAEIDSGNPGTNLCINCHQGRASAASVDSATAGMDADAVTEGLRFINVHYFAAGATLYGNEVQGAYQYAGNEYLGRNEHIQGFNNCTDCHSTHQLEVEVESCSTCHPVVEGKENLVDIRISPTDFDGDGDATEGIAGELDTMAAAVHTAMQDYAANTAGTSILYDAASYPYYFADADGNGQLDEGEGSYATWTPTLLKAAYNYQYVAKDPGAFAHNGKYILQVLFDTLADLGGDTTGMVRP